ncbi:MAG: glycoside hydrolase family 3 N-terminal domain-containing protein [Kosmotogaceae bacterium]
MTKNDLGKLFLLAFPGIIKQRHIELIRKIQPAGVLLRPDNMRTVSDLQINIERLHEIIDEDIKLLITSDHEGGQLETVPGIPPSPGNKAIGISNKLNYASAYGEILGHDLSNIGFNMLFAPVLDVYNENSNPVTGLRAYSDNHKKVSNFGVSFMKALQNEGILATIKHFPGHGKANQDSHYEIPVIENLDETDLLPFKESINDGAKAVMTAHILYPELDSKTIATLSEKILKDLLRKKMGFEGVIISDAVEMKALWDNHSPREIVELFYSATGDILLIGDTESYFEPLYESLLKAYDSGSINRTLLYDSVNRVKRIQNEFVSSGYKRRFLSDISKNALMLENKEEITAESITFVIPDGNPLTPADTSNKDYIEYESTIKSLFDSPKIVHYDVSTGTLDTEVENADFIVSFVVDSFSFIDQLKMQKNLSKIANSIVYVILRDSRDIKEYQKDNYIATNSTKTISVYHALKAIREYVHLYHDNE